MRGVSATLRVGWLCPVPTPPSPSSAACGGVIGPGTRSPFPTTVRARACVCLRWGSMYRRVFLSGERRRSGCNGFVRGGEAFGPSRTAEPLFYLLSPLPCEQKWLHWPRNPPSPRPGPRGVRGCHCAAEGPRVGAAAGVSCWGARLSRPGESRL